MLETFNDNSQKTYEWLQNYWQSILALEQLEKSEPGVSKKEVVAEFDNIKLIRFLGAKKSTIKTPLLISYALVNRFNIADLQSGKSLVEKLLEAGHPVYVIDWGYPNPADRYVDLDTHINIYMDFCVSKLMEIHKVENINILGICQGGTLSICYTSLYSEKIKNLIVMVTPVDFQTKKDILSPIVQGIDLENYQKAFGNVSGDALNVNFTMLSPAGLNLKKWVDSVNALTKENTARFFLNMETWINDSPDQAGKTYCDFVGNFYQNNKLVKQNLKIGDSEVNTKNITQPVLNIFGTFDHLVPPESSKYLAKIVNSKNYEEAEIKTGHIGMYVSSKAAEVPEKIISWLKKHS